MQHITDHLWMASSLFKAHLDKCWMQQYVKYDFTADLARIRDRSVCEMSVDY